MSHLVNVQLSLPGDRRTSRMLLPVVGAIAGAVLLIAVGIILLQQTATENDPGLLFEIPAGASASVPAGLISAVDIPREIIFRTATRRRSQSSTTTPLPTWQAHSL